LTKDDLEELRRCVSITHGEGYLTEDRLAVLQATLDSATDSSAWLDVFRSQLGSVHYPPREAELLARLTESALQLATLDQSISHAIRDTNVS
jgi:hypothetical protein